MPLEETFGAYLNVLFILLSDHPQEPGIGSCLAGWTAEFRLMVLMLIACNIMLGLAVGLACRARAIVVFAPVCAAATLAGLLAAEMPLWSAWLWMSLCLFLGQGAFLLTSFWLAGAKAEAAKARAMTRDRSLSASND